MKYTLITVAIANAEAEMNKLAAQGWEVVCVNEHKGEIRKCFGLSNTVTTFLNIVLVHH